MIHNLIIIRSIGERSFEEEIRAWAFSAYISTATEVIGDGLQFKLQARSQGYSNLLYCFGTRKALEKSDWEGALFGKWWWIVGSIDFEEGVIASFGKTGTIFDWYGIRMVCQFIEAGYKLLTCAFVQYATDSFALHSTYVRCSLTSWTIHTHWRISMTNSVNIKHGLIPKNLVDAGQDIGYESFSFYSLYSLYFRSLSLAWYFNHKLTHSSFNVSNLLYIFPPFSQLTWFLLWKHQFSSFIYRFWSQCIS